MTAPGLVLGGVVPRLGTLNLEEAEALLFGLYLVDLKQLRRGVPPISQALQRGPRGRVLRYIRSDPSEHWQTIREIWRSGGGDCEDLAAAVAAEYTWRTGLPARPVIRRVRPGLAHATVEILAGGLAGVRLDPSRTGGMGEP